MNQCRNIKSYLYHFYYDKYYAFATYDRDNKRGTYQLFSKKGVVTYERNYQMLVTAGRSIYAKFI